MAMNEQQTPEKEPYIGSVRFFKNIILAIVIVLILVPTIFAIVYHSKYKTLLAEKEAAPVIVEETQAAVEEVPEVKIKRMVTVTDNNGNAVQMEVSAKAASDITDLGKYTAAAETAEYQKLYPDMYAPQELHATDRQDASVYLTFDGKLSGVTDELINLLAEKNVKATFFVQGEPSGADASRIETLLAQGHTVGMMGCSQEYNTLYATPEAYLDDLYKQFSAIKNITGAAPTAVRMPGGSINSYNHATYRQIIAELLRRGFVPYDCTVDADDTNLEVDATAIATRVIVNCENYSRSIVELHDSEKCINTPEAVNLIINTLQNEGYTFRNIETDTMPVLFSYPDYQEDIVYED